MIGQKNDGNTVTKDTTLHMVQWQPTANKEDLIFSVIYEFDDSKTISMYEKYLTEIVIPKIPQNATVILQESQSTPSIYWMKCNGCYAAEKVFICGISILYTFFILLQ